MNTRHYDPRTIFVEVETFRNWPWTVYVCVRLRRVSDGREVEYNQDCGYPAGEFGDLHLPTFMWSSDGNYGCDCNRHLFFERALGNDPECGAHPCSRAEAQEYKVVAPDWLADD